MSDDQVAHAYTVTDRTMEAGDSISVAPARWTFGDNVAEKFDDHISKSVPLYSEGHSQILALSEFFIREDSVCYELGCSTGKLIAGLASRHRDLGSAKFVGVDVEAEMVKHATSTYSALANLSFLVDDVSEFEFEKADMILSYYVMQFVPPKLRQGIYDKIYQALNWGGALVIFEKTRADDARFQDIFSTLYSEFKLTNGYNPEQILSKTLSLKGVLEPFTHSANVEFLKRAGFVDIMCFQKYLTFEGLIAIK